MLLDPTGHLLHFRPHYQDTESMQFYLIHRNKHREAAQMSRQRKELNNKEISNLSDAEFKTLVIRCSKKSLIMATA